MGSIRRAFRRRKAVRCMLQKSCYGHRIIINLQTFKNLGYKPKTRMTRMTKSILEPLPYKPISRVHRLAPGTGGVDPLLDVAQDIAMPCLNSGLLAKPCKFFFSYFPKT